MGSINCSLLKIVLTPHFRKEGEGVSQKAMMLTPSPPKKMSPPHKLKRKITEEENEDDENDPPESMLPLFPKSSIRKNHKAPLSQKSSTHSRRATQMNSSSRDLTPQSNRSNRSNRSQKKYNNSAVVERKEMSYHPSLRRKLTLNLEQVEMTPEIFIAN